MSGQSGTITRTLMVAPGWFSLVRQALDGLEAIHPVVCGLHWFFPCPQAADAFHRLKRGLDEVS